MKTNKNVTVVSCPPCGENVALATKRGAYKAFSLLSPSIGPTDHFLHKGGRKGFTLIELLVVVLIIGLLAAVAVPQYRLAVEKTKASTMLSILKSLDSAQKIFEQAHGNYATTFDELDVEIPSGGNINEAHNRIEYSNKQILSICSAPICIPTSLQAYPNTDIGYYLEFSTGAKVCQAEKTNSMANKICHSLAGDEATRSNWIHNTYELE